MWAQEVEESYGVSRHYQILQLATRVPEQNPGNQLGRLPTPPWGPAQATPLATSAGHGTTREYRRA
ncbi:hypothetical protein ANO14919_087910 [Xylariales sp. No.14919]|nr:hypothetical protein ANO14919_087910 [Xylariales sp. No.14919]